MIQSYGNLAKVVDFDYWWSCIRKGLHLLLLFIFTEKALLADSVSKSQCPSMVYVSVCAIGLKRVLLISAYFETCLGFCCLKDFPFKRKISLVLGSL